MSFSSLAERYSVWDCILLILNLPILPSFMFIDHCCLHCWSELHHYSQRGGWFKDTSIKEMQDDQIYGLAYRINIFWAIQVCLHERWFQFEDQKFEHSFEMCRFLFSFYSCFWKIEFISWYCQQFRWWDSKVISHTVYIHICNNTTTNHHVLLEVHASNWWKWKKIENSQHVQYNRAMVYLFDMQQKQV